VTVADLATLKTFLGITGTKDDEVLQADLDAATAYIVPRVVPEEVPEDDVQLAIIMTASRLYARRRSPEGVAGFAADGLVVRIIVQDPDIFRLVEWHLDMSKAGIA
jgi:gp6-like head-tail connector protein